MQIQGRIIDYDPFTRIITVEHGKAIRKLYFQRAIHNRFAKFLSPSFFIVADCKKPGERSRHRAYVVTKIKKIAKAEPRKLNVLFSENKIKNETRKFINSLGAKLFLDFEMSMHPYKADKSFIQEIIQVGYVLVDANDQVIDTYSAFVQPTRHKRLTKRTTKFLSLTQEEVSTGLTYREFYDHLKSLLKTHKPAIIVWGRNDFLSLRDSYRVNRVRPLTRMTRFVNLLKLHKNYFHFKDDLGLLNAYRMYGHENADQRHDALEDAMMTKRIFDGFKAHINNPQDKTFDPLK